MPEVSNTHSFNVGDKITFDLPRGSSNKYFVMLYRKPPFKHAMAYKVY